MSEAVAALRSIPTNLQEIDAMSISEDEVKSQNNKAILSYTDGPTGNQYQIEHHRRRHFLTHRYHCVLMFKQGDAPPAPPPPPLPPPPPFEWTCTHCTYLNTGGVTVCEMCGMNQPDSVMLERDIRRISQEVDLKEWEEVDMGEAIRAEAEAKARAAAEAKRRAEAEAKRRAREAQRIRDAEEARRAAMAHAVNSGVQYLAQSAVATATFQYVKGYLPKDNDICTGRMTIEEAKKAAAGYGNCIGITWRGAKNAAGPVEVWLKNHNCSSQPTHGQGWHTLLLTREHHRPVPPPPPAAPSRQPALHSGLSIHLYGIGQHGSRHYFHSNSPEGGGMSWGHRDPSVNWVLEFDGPVRSGMPVHLRSRCTGMYWHSNNPLGQGMSWGLKDATYGWEIKFSGDSYNGMTVHLLSKSPNLRGKYMHSHSPEGKGMSWGGHRSDLGWRLEW